MLDNNNAILQYILIHNGDEEVPCLHPLDSQWVPGLESLWGGSGETLVEYTGVYFVLWRGILEVGGVGLEKHLLSILGYLLFFGGVYWRWVGWVWRNFG